MSKPILYSGTKNASSWAFRAWLALRAAGYDFEDHVVDIRRPQRYINLAEVGQISPPSCVPVLDTGRTIIFESAAIMEFANDYAGGTLLPADIESRAQARALVLWQVTGLSNICPRISFESSFYPAKRALSRAEQAEAGRLFDVYEAALAASGGQFLFGDWSLADCMHVPTIIKFARHNLDTSSYPLSQNWIDTVMRRPDVCEWLAEADQLPHIWFQDYLLDDKPPVSQLTPV